MSTEAPTQIARLYVALFGRAAEKDGLAFWQQQVQAGLGLADAADRMFATAPARAFYPQGAGAEQVIAAFYANVLGRTADAEGLAYWSGKLKAPGASPGQVLAEMIQLVAQYSAVGGTDPQGKTSEALFANRVEVAEYFAAKDGTLARATTVLQGVTADRASVLAAKNQVDAWVAPAVDPGPSVPSTPQTVAFTAGADVLTGGSGDDTFTGTAATLSAADQVNGLGGTDTLKLTGTVVLPQMSSIETLHLDNPGAGLDVSGLTDVTTLMVENDPGQTWTLNANQNVSLKAISNNSTRFVLPAGDKSLTLTIDSQSSFRTITVEGPALETLTVVPIGTRSTWSLVDAAAGSPLTSVLVSGTSPLIMLLDSTKVTAMDASKNGGGVSVRPAVVDFKFTGGSGSDEVVILDASTFTVDDQLDGGGGSDTLYLQNVAMSDPNSGQSKALASVMGFERVRLGGGSVVLDATSLPNGLNELQLEQSSTVTLTNLTSTHRLIRAGGDVGNPDTSLSMAAGQDELHLNVATGVTIASNIKNLVLQGVQTLQLTSSHNSASPLANANTVNLKSHADGLVVNISGAQPLTLSGLQGTTSGVTVNGASATGILTLTGSAQNDTITGGTAADVITGGAGADMLTGGGGADVFVVASGSGGPANMDTINDFVRTTDKIAFKQGADAVMTGINISGTTTFAVVRQYLLGSLDDAVAVYVALNALPLDYSSSSNTIALARVNVSGGAMAGNYLFVQDGIIAASDNDILIRLVGDGVIQGSDFTSVA